MGAIELRIKFMEEMRKSYEVSQSLGRHLFDVWHIEQRCQLSDVVDFVQSDEVKRVFFIAPGLNRVKSYSKQQLEALGLHLSNVIDTDKRIYSDSKFGFHWQEKYNGMADAYSGMFELKSPEPEDGHLRNLKK